MIRTCFAWIWSHRKTSLGSLGLFLLFVFLVVNIVAYNHARAMTCFVPAGSKTGSPESLSRWEKIKVLLTGVTVPRPSNEDVTPADFGLSFEVHRIQGKGAVELEGWYVPNRKPQGLVLMYPAYTACKVTLVSVGKALHEMGYSLFLVDFRGTGGSTGNETTIGVREAEDVSFSMDYARDQWPDQPLILFGQSMGGAAVLRAIAIEGVRPLAVIVESPFDRLVTTVGHRFSAMGLPTFPGAHLLVFWGGAQHGFNGFAHNPVDYAKEVDCPVLLLHGGRDPRVTSEEAEAVYGALGGPKELVQFAEAGHGTFVEGQEDKWRAVVSEFLHRHAH